MTLATNHPHGWRPGVQLLVLPVAALLGMGCATRGSVSRVRDDVAALRVSVTELQQTQQAATRDLARVAAENRALEARLTEMATAQRTSVAEMARLIERVDTVEATARAAKVVVSAPPAPAPAPPVAPPAVLPVVPPVPPPLKDPPARAGAAEHVYSLALATFRAGEHGQAVLDFLDFMAKYPKSPLVANAQYWIGEAYYVQRDYRQAQTEFQKVLVTAPGSAKAGDALLKIGFCQLNLHDPSRARATWQRVVHEFPRSEAASKARTLLSAHGSAAVR